MKIVNFPKIAIGATFSVDGETYTKSEGLIYRDAFGFERYIDPLFDAKIGKELAAAPQVDTSAKIVKETESE